MQLSRRRLERIERAASGFRLNAFPKPELWDHQNDAIDAVSGFLGESISQIKKGKCASGAIVMPPGSGKTVLAAEIAKELGLRAIVLAPTVRIALQHYEELKTRAPDVPCSLFYSQNKNLGGQVIVTTYQSALPLLRRRKLPDDIDIAFYDEAHRSISPKRMKLHGRIAPVEIGLTATPAFNEDRQIWTAFNDIIYDLSIREAVEMGIMSPIRGFIIDTFVDVSKVKLRLQGELLNEAEAEKHLNILSRNKSARDFYIENFKGVPAVAFCVSQKHAEEFAEHLRKSSIRAAHIHGGVPIKTREKLLSKFEDGKLDVLTTRDVLVEGWDSQRLMLELCLRPTYSRVVKTHMVGRVARLREGKEAGLVAEFQDIYSHGEQPVLAHHVFDQAEYRQGGLIAAPKKKREEEARKLVRKEKVTVHGRLNVSYEVKKLISLDALNQDLRNPRLLREILKTASVPSWAKSHYAGEGVLPQELSRLGIGAIRTLRMNHPAFSGGVLRLMRMVFGLRYGKQSELQPEDFVHLLNYAYGDMPPVVKESEIARLMAGNEGHTMSSEDIIDKFWLNDRIGCRLQTLPEAHATAFRMMFGFKGVLFEDDSYTQKDVAAKLGRSSTIISNYITNLLYRDFSGIFRSFNGEAVPDFEKMVAAVFDEQVPMKQRNCLFSILSTYRMLPNEMEFHRKVLDAQFDLGYRVASGRKYVWMLGAELEEGRSDGAELYRASIEERYPITVRDGAKRTLELFSVGYGTKRHTHTENLAFYRNENFPLDPRESVAKREAERLKRSIWHSRPERDDFKGAYEDLKGMKDDSSLPNSIRSYAYDTLAWLVLKYADESQNERYEPLRHDASVIFEWLKSKNPF